MTPEKQSLSPLFPPLSLFCSSAFNQAPGTRSLGEVSCVRHSWLLWVPAGCRNQGHSPERGLGLIVTVGIQDYDYVLVARLRM